MNKNILIAMIVVLLFAVGGIFYFAFYGQSLTPLIKSDPSVKISTEEVRVINIIGSEFAYDVKEIRVKKGEAVKIVLTNGGKWPHDWVVDEFNARTAVINSGTTSVTFTPDKTGTFEFYCSVGTHRAMGMKGNLIVE